MTAGSISEAQIEQTMILLRAFGAIMGVQPQKLEKLLEKARKDLFKAADEKPGQGPPE